MSNERAKAIYELVSSFAEVVAESDAARQKALAVAWCDRADAYLAAHPGESVSTLATYIGLALMDDEGMGTLPGRVPDDLQQKVAADIFAVRALARGEDG